MKIDYSSKILFLKKKRNRVCSSHDDVWVYWSHWWISIHFLRISSRSSLIDRMHYKQCHHHFRFQSDTNKWYSSWKWIRWRSSHFIKCSILKWITLDIVMIKRSYDEKTYWKKNFNTNKAHFNRTKRSFRVFFVVQSKFVNVHQQRYVQCHQCWRIMIWDKLIVCCWLFKISTLLITQQLRSKLCVVTLT